MVIEADRDGLGWTRQELVLALELYCLIPFQKTKASNPEVWKLASVLGRTPAAVARKLGNFGAFDPELMKLNISGLKHTSKLDRVIWDEFNGNWGKLVTEAHRIRRRIGAQEILDSDIRKSGPSERIALSKQRLHQSFFRFAVLSSYNYTCCITGISVEQCLVASHIIPWSQNEDLRTEPTNGLSLTATYDRLFDRGLISISDKLTVVVSKQVLKSTNPAVRSEICARHRQPIILPMRFLPDQRYLNWHYANIFVDSIKT